MATYKSRACEFLDEFFSSGPDLASRYDYALQQLRLPGSLAQTTTNLGSTPLAPGLANKKAAIAAQAGDFQAFWLNALAGHGAEQKMRAGYLQAVQRARRTNPPKPLESFWVSDEPRFHLDVVEAADKVTVFVHTPLSRPANASLETVSVSWSIGLETLEGDEISIVQVSGRADFDS